MQQYLAVLWRNLQYRQIYRVVNEPTTGGPLTASPPSASPYTAKPD